MLKASADVGVEVAMVPAAVHRVQVSGEERKADTTRSPIQGEGVNVAASLCQSLVSLAEFKLSRDRPEGLLVRLLQKNFRYLQPTSSVINALTAETTNIHNIPKHKRKERKHR